MELTGVLLTRFIEFFILPPGNLLILLLICLFCWRKRGLVICLLLLGSFQVLAFSTPYVSNFLLSKLDSERPIQANLSSQSFRPEAIIVLGSGRNRAAIEYGGESPSSNGIERLRYAAKLHKETGLPILISGGRPVPSEQSEAALMADYLQNTLNTPTRWLEQESHTTWENAVNTDQMLVHEGIKSAWLVTHHWHMKRSLLAFNKQSLKYFPAPHSYGSNIPFDAEYMAFVPQGRAFMRSLVALHEWLGIAWYSLKYS